MDFGDGSYTDLPPRNTRSSNMDPMGQMHQISQMMQIGQMSDKGQMISMRNTGQKSHMGHTSQMSGIVHSPATTRDGRARMRRAGDAMKLIDDALTGDSMISAIASTSRNFDLERTLPPTRTTRFNTTRSMRKVDDSLFAEPVDMTMMLNETGYLFEPTTPHRYKSRIDDPTSVESASMGLFSDFKNSLSRYGSTVDLFQLIDSYVEVCEDNEGLVRSLTTSMRKGPGYEMAEDMEKLLKHEKQTWRLINALYKDRQSSASNEELMNVDDMMKQISEKQAVEKYFEADCDVRHAQIVIDWLEQNAADEIEGVFEKLQSYSSNVSWENTLHRLKKNKDQGIEDRHLISEMDPDAPSRQKRAIDELDRQDENQLLKIVFSFIRSGKIEEAEDFCVTHGQPWRAATLEGWRLHNDPNMEETGSEDSGIVMIEGNPHRDLWKAACWAMSKDETYNPHERALYGALCGNLSAMLEVSSSWEDHLWSHYKTMVDMATERHVQQTVNIRSPWQRVTQDTIPLPDGYWRQSVDLGRCSDIFDKIESSYDQIVREEALNPFHFVQRCIILNDISTLMERCTSWVDDASVHLLRFLVHVILFLRTLGVQLETEHCDKTIEAYVRKLIADERTNHLVATYTAALPSEMQIVNYSTFLETITNPELQKEYLDHAVEAGLDIPSITKRVVESIRSIGNADEIVASDWSIEPPVTTDDRQKIEAIEWLVYDPSQRCEAVKQSNAIMRGFLASRKHTAAHDVFMKIPVDSIEVLYKEWYAQADKDVPLPPDADNAIHEHLCMKAYLSAHTSFKEWFKHYHTSKPEEPIIQKPSAFGSVSISDLVAQEHRQKEYLGKMSSWEDKLQSLCDLARDRIYNVLLFPTGWLVDAREDVSSEGEWRNHQMAQLRRICVPYLCNLLLTVLVDTRGRYGECGKLAHVLADEDYKLYELFTNQEGKYIMRRIQEALIQTL